MFGAAQRYAHAAATVDAAVREHLTRQVFDGAVAGRAHVAAGNSVRMAVEDITDRLRQWSRAAAEIAAALTASADRYADADAAPRLV